MDAALRQREHAAELERIRAEHRAWDERERAAAAKRDEEQRLATERALAEQQRRQDQEQIRQRAWGERLHALNAQLAAITAAISTANANALGALASGDLDGAGDQQARLNGLLTLRDSVEADLATHKRSG
jgi:hypothetical protein